jgi:hypothetical protein
MAIIKNPFREPLLNSNSPHGLFFSITNKFKNYNANLVKIPQPTATKHKKSTNIAVGA